LITTKNVFINLPVFLLQFFHPKKSIFWSPTSGCPMLYGRAYIHMYVMRAF
jgi:hypothetical protein